MSGIQIVRRTAAALAALLTTATLSACSPGSDETTVDSRPVPAAPTESESGESAAPAGPLAVAEAPDVVLLDQLTAVERVHFGGDSEEKPVVDGLSALNQSLLPYLAEQEAGKNVVFSAPSLYIDLAMLMEGSATETQAELLELLGLTSLDPETRSNLLGDFIASLNLDAGGPGVGELPLSLRSSQAIWLQEPYEMKQDYADRVAATYQADVYRWKPSEQVKAHAALDQWYSDKTLGLLPPGTVPADVPSLRNALVLLNALYFKANWITPFDDTLTEPLPFTLDTGTPVTGADGSSTPAEEGATVTVPTMSLQTDGQALVREHYTIAHLPMSFDYEARFALPAEGVSIDSLIDDDTFMQDFHLYDRDTLEQFSINWLVPQLDLTMNVDLTQASTDLGAPLIRDPREADLSAMLLGMEQGDLIVSEIKQDARLILDEEGIEAAAVTSIGVDTTSLPEPLPALDMHLNRPFLLEIRSPEGITLFTALVRNPSA